jgi:hypothetical protein
VPAPAAPTARWRDQRGLTVALVVCFGILVASAVVLVLALANRISVVGDVRNGNFANIFERAQDADDFVSGANAVFLLVQVVLAVLFIVWTFRAAKNNEALDRRNPRFGPGWAIGAWFIPLANLVIPVMLIQDLWRGATHEIPRGDSRWRAARGSLLVGSWWALWVLSLARLFAGSSSVDDRASLDEIERSNWIALVGVVLAAIAAVLAVFVVRALARRQLDALRAQRTSYDESTGPQPGLEPA